MAESDDLITALLSALQQDPQNTTLKLHIASLMMVADDAAQALLIAQQILTDQPGNAGALDLAYRSSIALGKRELATQYQALLHADESPHAETNAVGTDGPSVPSKDPSGLVRLTNSFGADGNDLVVDVDEPELTLDDVVGMESVKRQLRTSFLGPMNNPEIRAMYGKALGGGLLLWGPPGCGKTFIARALAGEMHARFYAVSLPQILDMYLGQSEQNLHDIFEVARQHAPCVLFLDEVDALAFSRASIRHQNSSMRNVISQFLTEMDSIGATNAGVFVLGATNQPWDLDAAFRRPGRFDKLMLVLPPDQIARAGILQYHLQNRPIGNVDLAALAARTDMYSGADLAYVCEVATEQAMARAIEAGMPVPITQKELLDAVESTHASTRPWFQSAKSFVIFGNQDGSFDELHAYLKQHQLL